MICNNSKIVTSFKSFCQKISPRGSEKTELRVFSSIKIQRNKKIYNYFFFVLGMGCGFKLCASQAGHPLDKSFLGSCIPDLPG